MRLGNVAKVQGGYAFKSTAFINAGTPIIRIGNLDGEKVIVDKEICYPEKFWEEHPEFRINNGDILIAMSGATVGKIGVYEPVEKALLNQRVGNILPKKNILKSYIYYYCMSPVFRRSIEENAFGCAQPNISAKQIEEFNINVPSIAEQEKAIKVLGKTLNIIRNRKKQLEDLDNLIKSRFVEMFGDPISNPNNFAYKSIGEVTKSITAGWSANGEARIKQPHEKAVLKVSAVTQGFFKPDEYKVIDTNELIKKYVFPQKGDLLFSRANTREMVGATAIIEQDYPDLILPDKLWKILFENTVNVYYMKFILSGPAIRAEFSAQSTGTSGSMYNVSMDKFKGIGIPIPPIELQDLFATFVQQVDKLKVRTDCVI